MRRQQGCDSRFFCLRLLARSLQYPLGQEQGDTQLGTQISIAKSINSVVDQSDSAGASSRVINAIQSAAYKTGVDFSYLMNKASQESSFDPSAKATASSATGLFQFTSQTWLHMVKTYGDQYGLGSYAAQILEDASGHLSVSDHATRQAILALRKDPQVSAEMAGELDKENAAALTQKVGGKIGSTELYLAHFLGAGGASSFIRQMRNNPKVAAADVLPTAAAANPSVFYGKDGQARSVQQIYQHFAQKFDSGSTQMASATTKAISSRAAGRSLAAASGNGIAITMANLMPTATSPATSAYNAIAAVHSSTNASAMRLASANGSTLFNAMLLGQAQSAGMTIPSPLAALNQQADSRKKDAYAILSAVG